MTPEGSNERLDAYHQMKNSLPETPVAVDVPTRMIMALALYVGEEQWSAALTQVREGVLQDVDRLQ